MLLLGRSACMKYTDITVRKVKLAHTRLPSVVFQSWSRFLAVSLHVTWVINPAAGCHYFLPGPQLLQQPLRGLLPILLLAEQRHDGCEQFAWDCYPTASQLRFDPGPFCAWVQHANHSATEPPYSNEVRKVKCAIPRTIHTDTLIFIQNLFSSVVYMALSSKIAFGFSALYCMSFWLFFLCLGYYLMCVCWI